MKNTWVNHHNSIHYTFFFKFVFQNKLISKKIKFIKFMHFNAYIHLAN